MRDRVKPTRRELARISRDLGLAREGCSILRDKNTVLVRGFHNASREILMLDNKIKSEARESWENVWRVLGEHGVSGGFIVGLSTAPQHDKIRVREDRVMGVRVHDVVVEPLERKWTDRGYGRIDTSRSVDEAARKWEGLLPVLVKAGTLETKRVRLGAAARRTRRRISAIERVLVPSLERARKRVALSLEEAEREEFLKAKRVKHRTRRY